MMNKLLRIIAALTLCAFSATPVLAVATQYTSPSYGIGSIIVGGTGTLRTIAGSIPPVFVTGPNVVNITTTSAQVQWTTDHNTTGIAFVGTASGVYDFQAGDTFTASTSSHDVSLNFLTKGVLYYYKVRSSDVYGNMIESSESTFSSDAGDITPPLITSGPTTAQTSNAQVTVTWTTDELSSSVVDYGVSSVAENSVGRSDERTLFHQVVISGVSGGQPYKYKVTSKDDAGNAVISPEGTFETASAPGITGVKITDTTLTSTVVQWSTTVATSTTLRYGTATGDYTQVVDDPTLSESHLVRLSGLTSGTIFYLRLSGADASSNRISSDEYIFQTVVLPTIGEVVVSNIGSQSVTLSWSSSSNIDTLVQGKITKSDDPKQIGKPIVAANNDLKTTHVIQLTDLNPSTTYEVTAFGKDQFGNQAISAAKAFRTAVDTEPPDIESLRSDTTVDLGSRQTVQVLVSFGLSELGKAIIQYGEGSSGSYTKKVETDVDYSKSKFLVIPALQPGNSYHFQIVATDKAGNVTTSPDYLVLAPTQPVSLLDLIFGQITSNFGWLSNL